MPPGKESYSCDFPGVQPPSPVPLFGSAHGLKFMDHKVEVVHLMVIIDMQGGFLSNEFQESLGLWKNDKRILIVVSRAIKLEQSNIYSVSIIS